MSASIKGFLDIAVLKVIEKGEMHGYSIVNELKSRAEGNLGAGEGTVYPLLIKLESKGLVRSRWDKRRRYYSLTAAGKKALVKKTKDWFYFQNALSSLLEASS
jgi:PadR family transcriptional regulator PadR